MLTDGATYELHLLGLETDEQRSSGRVPLVLDVKYGGSRDGTLVQVYPRNSTRAQFWRARLHRVIAGTQPHLCKEEEGVMNDTKNLNSSNVFWTFEPQCATKSLLAATSTNNNSTSSSALAVKPTTPGKEKGGESVIIQQRPFTHCADSVLQNQKWIVDEMTDSNGTHLQLSLRPFGRGEEEGKSGSCYCLGIAGGAAAAVKSSPVQVILGSTTRWRPVRTNLWLPSEGAIVELSCRHHHPSQQPSSQPQQPLQQETTTVLEVITSNSSSSSSSNPERGGHLSEQQCLTVQDSQYSGRGSSKVAFTSSHINNRSVSGAQQRKALQSCFRVASKGQFFLLQSMAWPGSYLTVDRSDTSSNSHKKKKNEPNDDDMDNTDDDDDGEPEKKKPLSLPQLDVLLSHTSMLKDEHQWSVSEEEDGWFRLAPLLADDFTELTSYPETGHASRLRMQVDIEDGTLKVIAADDAAMKRPSLPNQLFKFVSVSSVPGMESEVPLEAVAVTSKSTAAVQSSKQQPSLRGKHLIWATYHHLKPEDLSALTGEFGLIFNHVTSSREAWQLLVSIGLEKCAVFITAQLSGGISDGYLSGLELLARIKATARQKRIVPPVLVFVSTARCEDQAAVDLHFDPSRMATSNPDSLLLHAHEPWSEERERNAAIGHAISSVLRERIKSTQGLIGSVDVTAALESLGTNNHHHRNAAADTQPSPVVSSRFEMQKVIGNGAFGTVYRVLDSATGEVLARKTIPVANVGAAEAVLREMDILARFCDHPNIVRIRHVEYDRAHSEAHLYLDYISGGTLIDLLSYNVSIPKHPEKKVRLEFRLHEQTVRLALVDALRGLAHLHAHGVGHFDIKPQNMLIDFSMSSFSKKMDHESLEGGEEEEQVQKTWSGGGVVKLADFGLASVNTASGLSLTRGTSSVKNHQLQGTPAYMAPEVCNGHECLASDIWAMAVSAIHLLAGEHPWPPHLVPIQLMFQIAVQRTVPEVPAHVSPSLRAILESCLAYDPSQRPTANALLKLPYFATVDKTRKNYKTSNNMTGPDYCCSHQKYEDGPLFSLVEGIEPLALYKERLLQDRANQLSLAVLDGEVSVELVVAAVDHSITSTAVVFEGCTSTSSWMGPSQLSSHNLL